MLLLILALIFALFVAIFAIQNNIIVSISLFFWSFQTSLVMVIIGSTLIGAVVLLLIALYVQIPMKFKLRKALKELSGLENENNSLKVQLEELTQKCITKDNSNLNSNEP